MLVIVVIWEMLISCLDMYAVKFGVSRLCLA